MEVKTKQVRKALVWHFLLILCTAAFSVCLAMACEALTWEDLADFWSFAEGDRGRLVLTNTALLAFVLILALYFLTTKISAALALVSIPLMLCHIIHYFKLKLRNEPFYPWDYTLAGEATGILGTITLEPSKMMLLAIGAVAGAIVVSLVLDILVLRRNRPKYGVSFLCGAALLVVFGCLSGQLLSEEYIQANTVGVRVYNQNLTYRENGFVYAFAANYYHARTEAPEGYSAQSMEAIAGEWEAQEGSVEPNVIIIMSEAFSDIWNAENLCFDEELAPTFTALAEQYLSGRCMTSEYGGNTANCEFEVLTGCSTYLFPSGTVPYMSYMNQQTDSIVSFLKSKDYYTVALHPFRRSFFSREKAYELLGFEDYYSEEHFGDAERLRAFGFVSDDAVADRIIAEFEQNQSTDRGFFCHTVTMLNHTAYYASDWAEELQVGMEASCELSQTEYESLRSYATGLRYADAMLAKLVDYFSNVEEPTVILFFGDHQPSLGSPGYELMQRIGYVEDNTTDQGRMLLQSTPYLIWNNFEEEPTAAQMDMSMFHLLPYMTRTLDMDRPGFYSYMDSLFEEVRGVTRRVCLDGSGNAILTLEGEAQEKFDEYLSIVYDSLIGKQYSSRWLYGSE